MAIKFIRAGALALALAGPAAVVTASPAHATTFAEMSVEQLTDAAEYVVRGDVQDTWTEVDASGRIWTRTRVTITETYKGPDAPTELVIDSEGGEYAGQTLSIPGRAVFSKYEEVVVFLTKVGDDRLVPVAKFLGKYTIRRAPEDREPYVRTWQADDGLPFDARFLPHPAAEDRLYLNTFLEQVQNRLDAGWDGKPIPGLTPDQLRIRNAPERRMPR